MREDEPSEGIALTPEELAMIDEAEAQYQRGEGMTLEAALELAKRRADAWVKTNLPIRDAS